MTFEEFDAGLRELWAISLEDFRTLGNHVGPGVYNWFISMPHEWFAEAPEHDRRKLFEIINSRNNAG